MNEQLDALIKLAKVENPAVASVLLAVKAAIITKREDALMNVVADHAEKELLMIQRMSDDFKAHHN
jgi:hypothetical protein